MPGRGVIPQGRGFGEGAARPLTSSPPGGASEGMSLGIGSGAAAGGRSGGQHRASASARVSWRSCIRWRMRGLPPERLDRQGGRRGHPGEPRGRPERACGREVPVGLVLGHLPALPVTARYPGYRIVSCPQAVRPVVRELARLVLGREPLERRPACEAPGRQGRHGNDDHEAAERYGQARSSHGDVPSVGQPRRRFARRIRAGGDNGAFHFPAAIGAAARRHRLGCQGLSVM